MKTHIQNGERTLCGRRLGNGLIVIHRSTPVDFATCLACHQVDDARQAADYRRDLRERAEAGDREAQDECASLGVLLRRAP